MTIGALADGEYTWSVQPIGEAGDPAPASEPRTFAVGEWPFGATPASGPGAEALLDVEHIQRRKDTSMLLLEADFSYEATTGDGDHFWDSPHGNTELGGHPGDPADNMNAVEASVAMINGYLGGFVSQDRLGYEVFKDRSPGPERDLSYGDPKTLDRVQKMAEFAFGGFIQLCSEDDMEAQWEFVKGAIDEDLPLIAFSSGSPLPSPDDPPIIGGRPPAEIEVIIGYHVSDAGPGIEPARFFAINDARHTEAYAVELRPDSFVPFQCFWKPSLTIGFFEETSLSLDSDGDEINDFDETERFHTNPNDADTDGDGVSDKEEVSQSLFGPLLIGDLGPEARDWDKDGVPMELDCDSDNDGIMDGEDDDDFSVPEVPQEADCGTPDAYIGSTHMFQTGGGRMNVAVTQDMLFVRDPGDPNRYEVVSGTLTYSVSDSYFPDCEVAGSITVPIEPGDADFDFITGVGPPSLLVGTGNTPGLEVPAIVTCPDQSTFEVMASTQIWFWPQKNYTNLNHLAGEFTPSFGDGYTTYTWDFYGTDPP